MMSIKWMLKWNLATEDLSGYYPSDKEIFNTKDELLERLDELKEKHEELEGLEYKWGRAKKVMRPKWLFLSELEENEKPKVKENIFKREQELQRTPKIEDYV